MSEPCPDKLLLLHGLVDDELDAANALELEAHLKTCPGCAAELDRLRALKATLADPALRYAAPEPLRARITAALDAEARGSRAGWRPKWRFGRLGALIGGGGIAAAAAASLALVVFLPMLSMASLDRQVVDDHVRSLLAQHLTDVVSEDRHTVKPWFAGRIDYSPPVMDLKDQGFPLAGGRLDYVDGKVTAALVYRRKLHVINLFVRPEKAAYGQGVSSLQGYNVVRWRAGGLEFWAVSDLNTAELEQFRDLFKARAAG
jgi:anti-sigma factor RsiW